MASDRPYSRLAGERRARRSDITVDPPPIHPWRERSSLINLVTAHPSNPAQVVLIRTAAVVAAVAAVAVVHLPARPASLCLLRSLTGIPCPFCGGTTAAVSLGHGHMLAALSASPLALLMLVSAPLAGVVPMPRWWRRPRLRRSAILLVLLAAELWELRRFGLIALGSA